MTDDPDEFTRAELAAEARARRRHQRALTLHPDCRDPDHPGCDHCEQPHETNE